MPGGSQWYAPQAPSNPIPGESGDMGGPGGWGGPAIDMERLNASASDLKKLLGGGAIGALFGLGILIDRLFDRTLPRPAPEREIPPVMVDPGGTRVYLEPEKPGVKWIPPSGIDPLTGARVWLGDPTSGRK